MTDTAPMKLAADGTLQPMTQADLNQQATDAAVRPAPPFLTGRDVVDGMSPAQAKAADAADPRDLARVSAAARAAEVKSCIGRIAKANGMKPEDLLAQATPTGGL